jgi:hypothetical protein
LTQRNFAHVHGQNLLATTDVRQRDIHLTVKTTGVAAASGCRVVGRGHYDHTNIGFKPSISTSIWFRVCSRHHYHHPNQHRAGAHGVNLVNEDDAGRIFLALSNMSRTRSTHAETSRQVGTESEKTEPSSPAILLASRVLPVPGDDQNKPRECDRPISEIGWILQKSQLP